MFEKFIDKKFGPERRAQIDRANEIIEQYKEDGIQLTLRQLYYQFVSRNWLANTEASYKNLGDVISDARLAGLINWSAISDLGRTPSLPGNDGSKWEFLNRLSGYATVFALDRWRGQRHYVELHVEKQALSSVLGPVADDWMIGFSMNKGYASQTAFYDASKRFIEAENSDNKECVCLYVGDHDPSGLDMIRDFRDRMEVFGANVEVIPIALTRAQVRQYGCPPNPAKMTDARADAYVAEHGRQSWEVDALDPKVLRTIVNKAIATLVDKKMMDAVLEQQAEDRIEIAAALEAIR